MVLFLLFPYTFSSSLSFLLLPRFTIVLHRRHIDPFPCLLLLFGLFPLPVFPLLSLPSLPRLLPQEILAALDLQIDLTLLPRGREGRVRLPALVRHLQRFLPLAQRALFEMRQEAVPVLVGERRIGAQFALDH